LTDNVRATIRFFIGQTHIDAGIPFPKWTVNPDILRMPDSVPLTVTMKCIPCAVQNLQEKVVTYSAQKGASSEAIFEILPERGLARSTDGLSQIVFDVAADGIEYDHIVMDVYVLSSQDLAKTANNPTSTAQTPTPDVVRATRIGGPPSGEPEGSRKADIVFQFSRDDKLHVRILPIRPEIKALLGQKFLQDGEIRKFNAGLLTEGTIQAETNEGYVNLTSVIEPQDEAVQNLLSGHPGDVPDVKGAVKLTPSDRNAILKVFLAIGADFYSRMFVDTSVDPDLAEFMSSFQNFISTHRGLRVQIFTSDISVPWQLLHPPSPSDQIDSTQFWGFCCELTIVPFHVDGGTPQPLLDYSAPNSTVFAGYHADDDFENARIVQNAKDERDLVAKALHQQIELYDNSGAFLDSLDEHRDSVELILAYTHATSGTIDFSPRTGGPIFKQDGNGPRIMFSPTAWAKPRDIYELSTTRHPQRPDHKPFFIAQPLVFLNACETATLGFNPQGTKDTTGTTAGFPETMLRLGARGVIGTESRVWAPFALSFGNDLLLRFFSGMEAPKALLEVRLAYDSPPYNNPLGLLYSYYGNPDVKIAVNPNIPNTANPTKSEILTEHEHSVLSDSSIGF
jgi:hypothetical protein